MTVDAGFYKEEKTYTIGDYVWEDTNKDGIQNEEDKPLANVTVTLTKPDGSTETAVTDADGHYAFTNLPNGTYTVTFTTPEGYEPTSVQAGNDGAVDSNGTTVNVTVQDADDLTIDSGFTTAPTDVPPTDPEEPQTPPEEPEVPNKPETPETPELPEVPANPETPQTTPEQPEVPANPEAPQTTPAQPSDVAPATPSKTTAQTPKAHAQKQNDKKPENALPDTGQETNTTLWATLLAGLGALFAFGRRRNSKNDK